MSEMDKPSTELLKALFTYTIAAAVVIGGGIMLYLSRVDANIEDLRVVVAGFIGSSLTFLYGQEVQTRTARQSVTASDAGRVIESSAPKNGA